MMNIIEVPVSEIGLPPDFSPALVLGAEDFHRLKSSLEQHGLLQPLVIDHNLTGATPYQVLLGRRRLLACRELGWTTVACLLLSPSEPPELLQATERLTLRAPHFVEQALMMHDLHAAGLATVEDLSSRFHISPTQVLRFLDLAKSPAPILHELRRIQHLSFSHAYQIAAFGAQNPEAVFDVLRRVQRGAPAPYVIRCFLRRELPPKRRVVYQEVLAAGNTKEAFLKEGSLVEEPAGESSCVGHRLRLRVLVEYAPDGRPAENLDVAMVRRWMMERLEERLASWRREAATDTEMEPPTTSFEPF